MHCRNCDYPLWNLKTRQCPECGHGFRPSDFEFVPSSVQFCCPHCNQSYYGLGVKGHLVPAEFDCVKCEAHITMDECVLRPTSGVAEEHTRVHTVPWLERQRIGNVRAWLGTVAGALVTPTRMLKAASSQERTGDSRRFFLVTLLLTNLIGLFGVGVLLAGADMLWGGGNDTAEVLATFGIMTLVSIVGTILFIALWGWTTHGLLRITGGAPQPIARTFEGLCYSTGVLALAIIPFVNFCTGFYIIPIWWAVSAVLCVWKAQGVHGGRATFAVLTFPAVCVLLFFVGYGLFVYLMMAGISSTTRIGPGWTPGGQADVQAMSSAIDTYAAGNSGAGPPHAAAMLLDGTASEGDFISTTSPTLLEDVLLTDDVTFDDLAEMTYSERSEAIQAAIDVQPSNVVAHRVGDFVFTYHGIDLSQPPRGLWVFVMCDDPGTSLSDPGSGVWIQDDAGSSTMFAPTQVLLLLQQQNALRRSYGLPPLPDPLTLRQRQPAVDESPEAE